MGRREAPFYLQGERQGAKERAEIARELLEMRDVLSTSAGRAVFLRVLDKAGVLSSVDKTSAEVYRQAAQQEFGLDVLKRMYEAHPEASTEVFQTLMRKRIGDDGTEN